MLIFHSTDSNKGERSVGHALTHVPGLAFGNVLVSHGNQTREIDWVVLTPRALVAVEVKGSSQTGDLTPHLNGHWTIGGQPATFAGVVNPIKQVRVSAAIASRQMKDSCSDPDLYVHGVVVVTGDITLDKALKVGDTWVCLPEHLAGVLIRLANTMVTGSTTRIIASELGQRDLTEMQIDGEGFFTKKDVKRKPVAPKHAVEHGTATESGQPERKHPTRKKTAKKQGAKKQVAKKPVAKKQGATKQGATKQGATKQWHSTNEYSYVAAPRPSGSALDRPYVAAPRPSVHKTTR